MATARASNCYLLPLIQISDSIPDTNDIQPPQTDTSCSTKSDKQYNTYIEYLDNLCTQGDSTSFEQVA